MAFVLQVVFLIPLLIVAAKLLGWAAARIGLPAVLGELVAGVLLGPTVINIWNMRWLVGGDDAMGSTISLFKILAEIGVVILMFIAGLETDVQMARQSLRPALFSATGGSIFPMAGGYLFSRWAGLDWQQSLFIGTILTATSVTITAQTLINLNKIKSRAGSTILGGAVIDDVMGLIVLSVVIAISTHGESGGARGHVIILPIAKMIGCLSVLVVAGPLLTKWVMRVASRGRRYHSDVIAASILALSFGFGAEKLGGIAAITGSYLAGLFVGMSSSHLKVLDEIRTITNYFFGPLFFVSIGLDINARQIGSHWFFFSALLLIAIAGKVFGCGLGATLSGSTWRESVIVGMGMVPRGEVGLITASIGFDAGLVTRDVYAQAIVLVLITTLITPALLRYAFPKEPVTASVSETAAIEISLD